MLLVLVDCRQTAAIEAATETALNSHKNACF
jgi:hypothetical protein